MHLTVTCATPCKCVCLSVLLCVCVVVCLCSKRKCKIESSVAHKGQNRANRKIVSLLLRIILLAKKYKNIQKNVIHGFLLANTVRIMF